jgi:hypothetical protein
MAIEQPTTDQWSELIGFELSVVGFTLAFIGRK